MLVGTKLGPYEIVEPLGHGGMGEVYRARDTRLRRQVAIKTISARAGIDPEARERFNREARAVAALSHPNILAIYDVGTHKGMPFLAVELLDGETLRSRIEASPLPLSTVLDYGEAADELERALELDPDYPQAHWRMAGARAALGDYDAAIRHAARFAELASRSAPAVTLLAEIHAKAGRMADARRLLDEYHEMARRQYVPPTSAAGAYAALGEVEAALAALERGFDEGSNQIAYLADEPSFAPIRGHPRYQALLAKAGLAAR